MRVCMRGSNVIEETDAGVNVVLAGSVDIDLARDVPSPWSCTPPSQCVLSTCLMKTWRNLNPGGFSGLGLSHESTRRIQNYSDRHRRSVGRVARIGGGLLRASPLWGQTHWQNLGDD